MRKSVALLCGRWLMGGVENFHVILGNALCRMGYDVSLIMFEIVDDTLLAKLDGRVKILCLGSISFGKENEAKLRAYLSKLGATAILNGWCLPWKLTRFIRRATNGLDVKLIAVHHTQPDTNARVESTSNRILKWLYRKATALSVRYVYRNSDAYVVSSQRYRPIVHRMVGAHDTESKVAVIHYPLTADAGDFNHRENVVLYVGRLHEVQKRVSRLLAAWKIAEPQLPDWSLEIVGDGPDRTLYEEMAASCLRVKFMGFQHPVDYAKAKIFAMTSEYEGMPLVLPESMNNGCVPVVSGSFLSAYDVIPSHAGVITEMPFDAKKFAAIIVGLASDSERLARMSEACVAECKKYSVEHIAMQWSTLIEECGKAVAG